MIQAHRHPNSGAPPSQGKTPTTSSVDVVSRVVATTSTDFVDGMTRFSSSDTIECERF